MRIFNYRELKDKKWDNEIIAYVAQIHEHKGKKELREINMEFNARYIKGDDMPASRNCI